MATSDADSCLSQISGETLEKARRELGEDPETRAEAVEELRAKIEEVKREPENEGIEFSRNDGRFLLRFLRAKKFDVERATKLYCNYYRFRHKYAYLLGDLHPRAVEHVLRSGIIGVSDLRRKDGAIVIQIRPQRWDPESVPFADNFKTLLLLLEKLIEDEENQVHGFAILNNQVDVPFTTIFKLSQTEQLRKGIFIELMQDSFPGRFKGMHLVNQAWYISLVLSIVRPFMKQKMRDRLFLHGSEYTSLYEHFEPDLLPPSLSGSGVEFDEHCLLQVFEKELAERPPSLPAEAITSSLSQSQESASEETVTDTQEQSSINTHTT